MPEILISACLLGLKVRYDEKDNNVEELGELVKSGKAIFICPEQVGGLATPREASEIECGKTAADVLNGDAKVVSKTGKDVTKEFVKGAQYTLEVCQRFKIKTAILVEGSPSCGSSNTLDGTFTKARKPSPGVTSELLMQNGVKIYNESNYPKGLLVK